MGQSNSLGEGRCLSTQTGSWRPSLQEVSLSLGRNSPSSFINDSLLTIYIITPQPLPCFKFTTLIIDPLDEPEQQVRAATEGGLRSIRFRPLEARELWPIGDHPGAKAGGSRHADSQLEQRGLPHIGGKGLPLCRVQGRRDGLHHQQQGSLLLGSALRFPTPVILLALYHSTFIGPHTILFYL